MALLACAALLSASGATADEIGWAGFSAGLKLGGVFAQHVGTEERDSEYEVSSRWRTGFCGGAFVLWPITSRFGLQQEAVFSQRGSRQDIEVDILELPTVLHVTYDMSYIDIPVMLRYTLFWNPDRNLYTLAGTAMSIMLDGRYTLDGLLDDGSEQVPLSADADLSEVDMFDFSMVYGTGMEFSLGSQVLLAEYRFTMGWTTLSMPTYAYVPFEDSLILVDNEPVPLKNQSHALMLGIRF
ncbi:PorT family protein [Candidatus Fermentibacteria bacterium]|nr:PorT family protein [Candidatus Fermentibacteria bacterium]